MRAIQNVRRICEEHLAGTYQLEVVDLYKNLPLARGDQIIAAPTLVKRLPSPLRRLIGRAARPGRPRSAAATAGGEMRP
jgi:circadian clock protein KaiB